jgi:hypothetical protein
MPDDLPPLVQVEPFSPPADFPTLFELLKNATSAQVVGEFLKKKNLPYSGTWDDLRTKRILREMGKGTVTMAELITLLSESEEHGRAHTFLYKCSKAQATGLIADSGGTAAKLGLKECLGAGRVLDKPSKPAIVSIRLENDIAGEKCLVVKIVERREAKGEYTEKRDDGYYWQKWKLIDVRAVNVFRLFSTGLLEIRVGTHDSSDYSEDISRLWKIAEPFFPRGKFDDFPLIKAKSEMLSARQDLKKILHFGPSSALTPGGNAISARPKNKDASIFEDKKVETFFGAFCDDAGELEFSNVHWLPGPDGLPSCRIRMILPEGWNEFIIGAHCSKADYEYVLNKIRTFSE